MHVRRDEGAGRIERLERETIVALGFQPIDMTEDVPFDILRTDLAGSGWCDACGQRAHVVLACRSPAPLGAQSPASLLAAARAPRAATLLRAAEQRDERAPFHSITSSASVSSHRGHGEAEHPCKRLTQCPTVSATREPLH